MLKFYSLEKKKMFSTGLVSVTRGQERSALRQLGNKTLNTSSRFSLWSNRGRKTQKESQELFLFLKDKIQSVPKIAFCRKKRERVSKFGRGDDFAAHRGRLSRLQSRMSPCKCEAKPFAFLLLGKSAPMLKTGEAKNTRDGGEMWSWLKQSWQT